MNDHVSNVAKAIGQKFISDAELDALFSELTSMVISEAEGKWGIPPILLVVLDADNSASAIMHSLGISRKSVSGRVLVGIPFQPGDAMHREIFDIGYGFDGNPVMVTTCTEAWLIQRPVGAPHEMPRNAPDKQEVAISVALTVDFRTRGQIRAINRDAVGLIRIGDDVSPDGFGGVDAIMLRRFYEGYFKRICDKRGIAADHIKRPPIHAEN